MAYSRLSVLNPDDTSALDRFMSVAACESASAAAHCASRLSEAAIFMMCSMTPSVSRMPFASSITPWSTPSEKAPK